jgi:ribosomal-protein-alanine N-acetyltransferase
MSGRVLISDPLFLPEDEKKRVSFLYDANLSSVMDYQIVTATWRDLNALRQLERVCFPEDAWPLLDLIAVLTVSKVVRLKAVVNENMVGFIAGDQSSDESYAWITTIGVLPGYQRMGIGAALLTACEAQITKSSIRLCVRPANRAAINLYHQFGYVEVSIWRDYYQKGADALVLEKQRCFL